MRSAACQGVLPLIGQVNAAGGAEVVARLQRRAARRAGDERADPFAAGRAEDEACGADGRPARGAPGTGAQKASARKEQRRPDREARAAPERPGRSGAEVILGAGVGEGIDARNGDAGELVVDRAERLTE